MNPCAIKSHQISSNVSLNVGCCCWWPARHCTVVIFKLSKNFRLRNGKIMQISFCGRKKASRMQMKVPELCDFKSIPRKNFLACVHNQAITWQVSWPSKPLTESLSDVADKKAIENCNCLWLCKCSDSFITLYVSTLTLIVSFCSAIISVNGAMLLFQRWV